MACGGAREDAQRGRIRGVRGQNREERAGGGPGRRRDELAALADDGRRAGNVVRAGQRGGQRQRRARPGMCRAAPVVVPLFEACRVLAVEDVDSTLLIYCLRLLIQNSTVFRDAEDCDTRGIGKIGTSALVFAITCSQLLSHVTPRS